MPEVASGNIKPAPFINIKAKMGYLPAVVPGKYEIVVIEPVNLPLNLVKYGLGFMLDLEFKPPFTLTNHFVEAGTMGPQPQPLQGFVIFYNLRLGDILSDSELETFSESNSSTSLISINVRLYFQEMNVIKLKEAGGGVSKNDLVISEFAGVENTRGNGYPLYHPFFPWLDCIEFPEFSFVSPKADTPAMSVFIRL